MIFSPSNQKGLFIIFRLNSNPVSCLCHKMNGSTYKAGLLLPMHIHRLPKMLRMSKQRPLLFAELWPAPLCSVKWGIRHWYLAPRLRSAAWQQKLNADNQVCCKLLLLLSYQSTHLLVPEKTGIPPSHHAGLRMFLLLLRLRLLKLLREAGFLNSSASVPSDGNHRTQIIFFIFFTGKRRMESSQMHIKGEISKRLLLSFQLYN